MSSEKTYLSLTPKNIERFIKSLLFYLSNKQKYIFYLNSNSQKNTSYIASSNLLKINKNDYQFGLISFDFKNKVDKAFINLKKNNPIPFPEFKFFSPEILIKIKNNTIKLKRYNPKKNKDLYDFLISEKNIDLPKNKTIDKKNIKTLITRKKYLEDLNKIKKHLESGNFYETNYCQNFFIKDRKINPLTTYFELNKKSPMPFSCFVKFNHLFLMCASPELFIKKENNLLTSRPIKGTIKKSELPEEDKKLIKTLKNKQKEVSENIMIVDLVRNDLSRVCKAGSVKVEYLCKVYSFTHLHHLISSIKGVLKPNISLKKIIKATFPIGSMTGAPKISSVNITETLEKFNRGLYSGSVGFIKPNQDFTFNVVIRSILYNSKTYYTSFSSGGAITHLSCPEEEYKESLLKINPIINSIQVLC